MYDNIWFSSVIKLISKKYKDFKTKTAFITILTSRKHIPTLYYLPPPVILPVLSKDLFMVRRKTLRLVTNSSSRDTFMKAYATVFDCLTATELLPKSDLFCQVLRYVIRIFRCVAYCLFHRSAWTIEFSSAVHALAAEGLADTITHIVSVVCWTLGSVPSLSCHPSDLTFHALDFGEVIKILFSVTTYIWLTIL